MEALPSIYLLIVFCFFCNKLQFHKVEFLLQKCRSRMINYHLCFFLHLNYESQVTMKCIESLVLDIPPSWATLSHKHPITLHQRNFNLSLQATTAFSNVPTPSSRRHKAKISSRSVAPALYQLPSLTVKLQTARSERISGTLEHVLTRIPLAKFQETLHVIRSKSQDPHVSLFRMGRLSINNQCRKDKGERVQFPSS